jgi:hypothetical protein
LKEVSASGVEDITDDDEDLTCAMSVEMYAQSVHGRSAWIHLFIKLPPSLQRGVATQDYVRGLRSAALDTADACTKPHQHQPTLNCARSTVKTGGIVHKL